MDLMMPRVLRAPLFVGCVYNKQQTPAPRERAWKSHCAQHPEFAFTALGCATWSVSVGTKQRQAAHTPEHAFCFVLFCWLLSYDIHRQQANKQQGTGRAGEGRGHRQFPFGYVPGRDSKKLRFWGSWSGSAPEPGSVRGSCSGGLLFHATGRPYQADQLFCFSGVRGKSCRRCGAERQPESAPRSAGRHRPLTPHIV